MPVRDIEIISDEVIAPGRSWGRVLEAGWTLRIVDIEGHQGVDFLCYNANNPEERYHAPNTLKAAKNIFLREGSVLYSDYANPLMTIVEDTCGQHDTLGGCCSAPSNKMLYGVTDVNGCRENFLQELSTHGMGWRDIVPNINFFCSVPVYREGNLAEDIFVEGNSKAGDYVELRAEMAVLVIISNCPQVNNPCNGGKPTPIRLSVIHFVS